MFMEYVYVRLCVFVCVYVCVCVCVGDGAQGLHALCRPLVQVTAMKVSDCPKIEAQSQELSECTLCARV